MTLSYKRIQLQPMTEQDGLLSEWLRQRYGEALSPTLFRALQEYYGADMIYDGRDPLPEALKEARYLAVRLNARAQYTSCLCGLHTPVIWTGTPSVPAGVPPTPSSTPGQAVAPEPTPVPAVPVLVESVPDSEPEEEEIETAASPAKPWSLDAMVASFETMETSRNY